MFPPPAQRGRTLVSAKQLHWLTRLPEQFPGIKVPQPTETPPLESPQPSPPNVMSTITSSKTGSKPQVASESKRDCPICGDTHPEVLHQQKFVLPAGHPLPDHFNVVSCCTCG